MNKRLLACFALPIFFTPGKTSAQFNDARVYDDTPVGVSQLELSYTYVRSNASLDPSRAITGASLNLNQGTIGWAVLRQNLERLSNEQHTAGVCGIVTSPVAGEITIRQAQGSTPPG